MIRKSCPGRKKEENLLKIVSGIIAIILWSIAASAAEPHHLKVDIPEKVTVGQKVEIHIQAQDIDNALVQDDSRLLTLSIYNGDINFTKKVFLKNGEAKDSLTLIEPGITMIQTQSSENKSLVDYHVFQVSPEKGGSK